MVVYPCVVINVTLTDIDLHGTLAFQDSDSIFYTVKLIREFTDTSTGSLCMVLIPASCFGNYHCQR